MIGNMSTPPANWDARKGDTVRKRRHVLGLDQRDLAAQVGVHVNSVQRWEAGTQRPGRHLGKLEAVLGIVIEDEPAPRPVISDKVMAAIMEDPELTDAEREAVLAAVKRQIAIERGWARSSPAPAAGPGRRRPAS